MEERDRKKLWREYETVVAEPPVYMVTVSVERPAYEGVVRLRQIVYDYCQRDIWSYRYDPHPWAEPCTCIFAFRSKEDAAMFKLVAS